MKKSLLALAVLAASGAAMAQSSVTLYGVADAGVTYANGEKNWSGVTSGNNLTSRLGFRGVEDLGGGLKANFVLEAGLNLDNGDGNSGYDISAATNGFAFKRQATVGLEGMGGRYPHEVSGGEQQRAAIARALVHQPRILLADEPTGNLDAINADEIIELLLRINKFGTTVILVTHNKEIVNRLNRRVITMEKGRVVSDKVHGKYLL